MLGSPSSCLLPNLLQLYRRHSNPCCWLRSSSFSLFIISDIAILSMLVFMKSMTSSSPPWVTPHKVVLLSPTCAIEDYLHSLPSLVRRHRLASSCCYNTKATKSREKITPKGSTNVSMVDLKNHNHPFFTDAALRETYSPPL